MEEETPKDNVAMDGGGRKIQGVMELLEIGATRGFRLHICGGKCPSLMCLLARRELRLR